LIFHCTICQTNFFWKSILTSAKYLEFKDIDKLSEEIRRVYYLYWIAGNTSTKVKQLSFNIIGWLKEKRDITFINGEIENKIDEDNVMARVNENLSDEAYGGILAPPFTSSNRV